MIIKDRKLNRANTDQDFINKVDAEKIKGNFKIVFLNFDISVIGFT